MQRRQFTFYESYMVAMESLPNKYQLPFVKAVCRYALKGEELPLTGQALAAFGLVKPVLDTAKRKAESGRVGGSKPKANRKQTGSEKEKETEIESEIEVESEGEVENECFSPSPSDDGEVAPLHGAGTLPKDCQSVVVGIVREVVGELSPKSRSELDAFVRDMGTDCIRRALDAARDAGKTNWNYVRGILRRKREQGVCCAADWDRLEAAHAWQTAQLREEAQARKPGGSWGARDSIAGTPKNVQPSAERAQKSADWLENFLKEQEQEAGA